jgi:hypothetical protein
LQQQDGFKGFIALGNRQSGELIGITFWESEQAMQASEEVGAHTRSETAEATGEAIEDVERYEVGLFEMLGSPTESIRAAKSMSTLDSIVTKILLLGGTASAGMSRPTNYVVYATPSS